MSIEDKRRELAEAEAALAENGGRGVELADRIDALRLEIGRETGEGPFGCANCGSDNIEANYDVATSQSITIGELDREDGTLDYDYDGDEDACGESGSDYSYTCQSCGATEPTLEALVGLPVPASYAERWSWTGWYLGEDVTPEEAGKEWLTIELDGEEAATIVLRTDASIFDGKPEALAEARAQREQLAEAMVTALRRGER